MDRAFADEFAAEIKHRTKDPLFSPHGFKELVAYLRQPYTSRTRLSPARITPYVHEITLAQQHPHEVAAYSTIESFRSQNLLRTKYSNSSQIQRNRIVFLLGRQDPEWFNTIASTYHLHAEFHLAHAALHGIVLENQFCVGAMLPSHPSRSTTLSLTITSIGVIEPKDRFIQPGSLAGARCHYEAIAHRQFSGQTAETSIGRSIIRRLNLHDKGHLTIEQDITVTVIKNDARWTVVVWSDSEAVQPVFTEPLLPLFGSYFPGFFNEYNKLTWCPTIIDRKAAEPNINAYSSGASQAGSSGDNTTFSHMPLAYGWTIPAGLSATSPFIACIELYRFMLGAELQFVNMIDQLLRRQIHGLTMPLREEEASATDFTYNQSVLEVHLARVIDTLKIFEDGIPKAFSTDHPEEASVEQEITRMRSEILKDLYYLRDRLNSSIERCKYGISQVCNNLALKEAHSANNLSNGLARLARLGTLFTVVYVPLSFVTAVFGMNLSEFKQGPVSMWLWALVSGPVLILSVAIFVWLERGPTVTKVWTTRQKSKETA